MSLFDSPEEVVDRYILNAYALQFTNGSDEEYDAAIEEAPTPVITVDCTDIETYEDYLEIITPELTTDRMDGFSDSGHITDHFRAEGGTLVLENFHELDNENDALKTIAQHFKGLAEQTDAGIILTTEDTNTVFRGNGDLSGRVRTVDFSEY